MQAAVPIETRAQAPTASADAAPAAPAPPVLPPAEVPAPPALGGPAGWPARRPPPDAARPATRRHGAPERDTPEPGTEERATEQQAPAAGGHKEGTPQPVGAGWAPAYGGSTPSSGGSAAPVLERKRGRHARDDTGT